jgi:hypothetical protein
MGMKLNHPFAIGPNLEAGIQIGKDWVTLRYSNNRGTDGRTRYRYTFLINGSEYTGSDLESGCQGGDLIEGFESLLSFLCAAAESFEYAERTGRKGENTDLFPMPVVKWASENKYAIEDMMCVLEESENAIME